MKEWDDLCPTCRTPVEITQTRADDGRAQYAKTCRTHGRLTLNYVLESDARAAPFISVQRKQATKHQAPVEPVAKKGP